jgi:lantibiotic biosynthesis protein
MWTPIIQGNDIKPYETLLKDVLKTVNDGYHDREMDKIDTMYGVTGFVLYLSYANRHSPSIINDEKISELINKTFSLLSEIPDTNLCMGIGATGVAWTFQHLIDNGFIDADFDELFSIILSDLEEYSLNELNDYNYDYLLGGLGFLLLILDSRTQKNGYLSYVEKVITILNRISYAMSNEGMAWMFVRNRDEFKNEDVVINLGISHGSPSIIILLGRIYEKYIELRNFVKPLIEKSLSWILSTKIINGSSSFGYSVVNNHVTANTTLRWCYGDLGIGVCLFLTGNRLDNHHWKQEGINTLLKCAKRLKDEINQIKDSHMCHGVAGVGHIFNRFYQYTQISEFRDAALICFSNVLERVKYENDSTLFLADKGDFGIIPIGGIMEGSAGISLILLSAITDIEPKWDSIFLLS